MPLYRESGTCTKWHNYHHQRTFHSIALEQAQAWNLPLARPKITGVQWAYGICNTECISSIFSLFLSLTYKPKIKNRFYFTDPLIGSLHLYFPISIIRHVFLYFDTFLFVECTAVKRLITLLWKIQCYMYNLAHKNAFSVSSYFCVNYPNRFWSYFSINFLNQRNWKKEPS